MNKQRITFLNVVSASKIVFFVSSIFLCNLFNSKISYAETLPQYDNLQHLGVASCASSNCHGSLKEYKESNILRNEFRTWQKNDPHSQAYSILLNKQSKEIARKLGLKNAHEEKECLDCHADNIPIKQRGKKFQISDGIGCEACHGGAEKYIKSHTEKNTSHKDNIKRGLFPTEAPVARAKLCLSCHYGKEDKFATHRIMAAGHPRLSFELDSFTISQEHYKLDEDYEKRKIIVDSVKTWAIGIAQTTLENMAIFRSPLFTNAGMFPEIALFDCHSCHHPMSDLRWESREGIKDLPTGSIRINDSYLMMLYVITRSISMSEGKLLLREIEKLHNETLKSKEDIVIHANKLRSRIKSLYRTLKNTTYNEKLSRKIRNNILQNGIAGNFRDYAGAEQVLFALELLNFTLEEDQSLNNELDTLFNMLKNEDNYIPNDFIQGLKKFQTKSKTL